MSKEVLHFNISAEFVTNIARTLYFEEDRDYKFVEDLLLSAMAGTTLTESELKDMARDILLGKLKLVGDSENGAYIVEDGKYDPTKGYRCYDKIRGIIKYHKPNLVEIEYDALLEKFIKDKGLNSGNIFSMCLGWLSPTGEFFERLINHSEYAYELIKQLGFWEDFKDSEYRYAEDYLRLGKGWILINNPTNAFIPRINSRYRISKKQKEFLYNYFMKCGKEEKAKEYLD